MIEMKNYIDTRVKMIVKNAENDINAPQPLIFTHHITIKEKVQKKDQQLFD